MSWRETLAFVPKPPDSRPIREIEQEILDELEFHVEMRTLDNIHLGMSAAEARQDAMRRFGDFEKIRKTCRQTLLGERIMLQRVQAVLTVVLLVAVVFMGVAIYRGQQANEAAMTQMVESLDRMAKQPSATSLSPHFEALEPSVLDQMFPRDAKLTDVQRGFRNWSEGAFLALDVAWWQSLNDAQKAKWEEKWISQLSSSSEKKREVAIQCLAGVGCKKAIPEILKIAAERVEKDNADRHKAVRALGIIGDVSRVPDLVPLTYHYNMNTRLEAQVALVRLTGENFGRDVAAWKAWWEKQGGNPPIDDKPVAWATSPQMLQYADPKKQEESDRHFANQANRADAAPSVVQTVPKNGDRNVDPSLKEIRVAYNKEMSDHSWSWCTGGQMQSIYPETTGDPYYEADKKTCVLPVKLEPGKVYTIRLNTNEYRSFKDTAGQSAIPYVLQFATRQEATTDGVAKRQARIGGPVDRRKGGSGESGDAVPLALDLPTADLVYSAAGSDEDAKAVISRVLKANHPWLDPKPVKATYSLLREADSIKERIGPFSISTGCKPAIRVGSIVWTPLHNMTSKDASYTVRMVGKTKWNEKDIVAVNVAFDPPARNAVGLGGQARTSYSNANYSTATARILIEPNKAIPLFIECWSEVIPQMNRRFHSAWAFDPGFFETDGGIAPRILEWEGGVSVFRERQEFQVVSGVWIFKQGDAWYGEYPFGKSGHIQKITLVDLQVAKEKTN